MLMNNTEAETVLRKDGNQNLGTLPDQPQYATCLLFHVEETNTLIKGAKLASCTPAVEQDLYAASISLEKKKKHVNPRDLNISTKMACSVCNKDFSSRDEQVQHYKLDWHRFNLKQKLRGSDTIPEELFDELAGDISSLSGSDSESDDGGDGNTSSNSSSGSPRHKIRPSAVPTRIRAARDRDLSFSASDTENEETDDGNVRSQSRMQPKIYFQNSDGKIISLYRCVIHGKKEIPISEEALLAKLQNIPEEMTWAIILVGGGHFAAALYDRANVVEHKTFHRYTVRAKQGSSQGLRDGRQGGHHSKSAGSSLRRYNEAALVKDIQDLLNNWSAKVQLCHRVFYRAPNFNRVILFGGKNPPFQKNDFRLRTIPFPTRRATYSEVQRVHRMLATLECFGDGTILNGIPHSPRVHLGTKKKKKKSSDFPKCAVGAVGESVDKKNNKFETEEPSQNGICEKDVKIQWSGDLASDSDASVTFESREEPLDENHFSEHDALPKSKQRKGKFRGPTSNRRQRDPEMGSAADEKYQMRSELYTACKNNDVDKLCELVSILSRQNATLNLVNHLQQDVECKLNPSLQSSVDLKTVSSEQIIVHNYISKGCLKNLDNNETVNIFRETRVDNVNNKDIADIPVYKKQKYENRLPFRRHSFTSLSKGNSLNYSMPNLNVPDSETTQTKHSSGPSSPRACMKKTRSCSVTVDEEISPARMSLSMINEALSDGGTTLLHTAANAGHSVIVKTLLEVGADPTIRNKKGQPPYVLSSNKETRNEFRRFMAAHPDKYDYNKAQLSSGSPSPIFSEPLEILVTWPFSPFCALKCCSEIPSALTADMENAKKIKQAEKKREKKKAMKTKLKDKKDLEMQMKKEEEEIKCFLALSDREKRALAAERRYIQQLASEDSSHPRPVLSRCFQCAVDITGKTPFEYLNYVFCSMPCLKKHRQTHT